MRRRLLAAVAVGLLVVGCGYQWAGRPEPTASRPRVAVDPLRNDSFEPGVDRLVTDALRREFQRRGGVELVTDADAADLVLEGSVLSLESRPEASTSVDFAIEYRLFMRLALQVSRAGVEEPIPLDPRTVQRSELYLASADIEVQRKNRREAMRRVASAIAERVHDALFEVP